MFCLVYLRLKFELKSHDSVQGAESLRPLVEKACKYIPKEQWTETPIGLKATAGLRLLSNSTAHQLLNKVL